LLSICPHTGGLPCLLLLPLSWPLRLICWLHGNSIGGLSAMPKLSPGYCLPLARRLCIWKRTKRRLTDCSSTS
jgi:hypothetical protein